MAIHSAFDAQPQPLADARPAEDVVDGPAERVAVALAPLPDELALDAAAEPHHLGAQAALVAEGDVSDFGGQCLLCGPGQRQVLERSWDWRDAQSHDLNPCDPSVRLLSQRPDLMALADQVPGEVDQEGLRAATRAEPLAADGHPHVHALQCVMVARPSVRPGTLCAKWFARRKGTVAACRLRIRGALRPAAGVERTPRGGYILFPARA